MAGLLGLFVGDWMALALSHTKFKRFCKNYRKSVTELYGLTFRFKNKVKMTAFLNSFVV